MSDTPTTTARVILWGSTIGYAAWNNQRRVGEFEYDPAFARSGIALAPLKMQLRSRRQVHSFPELKETSFRGLPGLLSDSLPDKFGNALITEWLARQGREPESMNPIERLLYIGKRGMGALEFEPAATATAETSRPLAVDELVRLASSVLARRQAVNVELPRDDEEKVRDGLTSLLVVGTSAGGARAKCLIAYNETTGAVRSGQTDAPEGFSHWLLKLDGVSANGDKELYDPLGYGAIEYAYYLMARACGIEMSLCELMQENGRSHFMTRRFDRTSTGAKIHMQSLCAMAHLDFNQARVHSYHQAFDAIRRLSSHAAPDLEQMYRRAVFNVVARNQDDHTKNIAFLMDRSGAWRLSPAYDMTYAYNPTGDWTARHQMLINGKSDGLETGDLLVLGKDADLRPAKAREVIDAVVAACTRWREFAARGGVFEHHVESIQKTLRLEGWRP
jgi:serine/threonine-protein kinase HipA